MRRLLALALGAIGSVGLLSAPEAAGSVGLGARQIVVTGTGARATITRAPFRISIDNGAGIAALAEIPNTSPLPAVLIPSDYPTPLGGKPEPENDLYAPLTFLVGSATTTQWGGGKVFFQGNQQAGLVTGIQYGARDVVSASQVGEGARLVLSTSDPTGRKLTVTVAPGPAGTIRVAATPSPSAGVAIVSDSFASDRSEGFHGFGGRHNAIDQHGNDFYSWIEQENSSGFPGGQAIQSAAAGQPNYMFPDGPGAAYTGQALFYSSRPYGFMLDQPSFARWRMDSDLSNAWQVSAYGTQLKYLVAPGPAASAIKTITAVTGRERVPPSWAIAPEIDRVVRATNAQTPAEAAGEISSDLANIARYQLPVSAYRPEAWTLLDTATQTAFLAQMHRQHVHLMRYFRAFVAYPTGGFEPDGDYSYAISHGLVATNPNGTPATFGSPYANGTAALIDFSNPAAVLWWQHDQLGSRLRDRLSHPRHAQPRRRRRLRADNRHRRIPRPADPDNDEGAAAALGGARGADTVLPSAQLRVRRHPHAVGIRHANPPDVHGDGPAAHRCRAADPQPLETGRRDRHPDPPASLARLPRRPSRGWPGRGVAARPRRARGTRHRPRCEHTHRLLPARLLAGPAHRKRLPRSGQRNRPGAARDPPLLLPLRHASVCDEDGHPRLPSTSGAACGSYARAASAGHDPRTGTARASPALRATPATMRDRSTRTATSCWHSRSASKTSLFRPLWKRQCREVGHRSSAIIAAARAAPPGSTAR